MLKFIASITVAALLVGCGSESASSAESGQAGSSTGADSSPDANHKWSFTVEGLPVKSGRSITAATMGGVGRYAMSGSNFTGTVGVDPDQPSPYMMFTFHDENRRCINEGDAVVTIEERRAVVSGQVDCMPKSGGEPTPAAISGWFELKQP